MAHEGAVPGSFIVPLLNTDGTPISAPREGYTEFHFGVRCATDTKFYSFHTTLVDAAQALRALDPTCGRWAEYRAGWRFGLGVEGKAQWVDSLSGMVVNRFPAKVDDVAPTPKLPTPVK